MYYYRTDGMEALARALLHAQVQIQVYHWNTASYAVHEATGDFYDVLRSAADGLVETWQGRHARLFGVQKPAPVEASPFDGQSGAADVAAYVEAFRAKVSKARAAMSRMPEMVNLVDDLLSKTDKALFLLSMV